MLTVNTGLSITDTWKLNWVHLRYFTRVMSSQGTESNRRHSEKRNLRHQVVWMNAVRD